MENKISRHDFSIRVEGFIRTIEDQMKEFWRIEQMADITVGDDRTLREIKQAHSALEDRLQEFAIELNPQTINCDICGEPIPTNEIYIVSDNNTACKSCYEKS